MVINQQIAAARVEKDVLSVEPKTENKPTISVIIPTYNNAAYLPAALDSVFAQAFPAQEIIVIDDGSTDETRAVLVNYAEKIRYFFQPNAGSAAARNKGLQLASGDYIVFLDADDYLLPGKFLAQAAILDKRPSVDMVHSGWQVIDEQGQLLHIAEPWHQAPTLDVISWFKTKPIRMGAMLFRRRCLEAVGGLDPGIRQSHDVDLLLRLALAGYTTAWLKQPTVAYRSYAASTIRRGARKQHGYVVRVMNKFFAHANVPTELREQEHRHRYYNLRWLAWHLVQSGFPDAIISPLRQAIVFSPLAPFPTIFDVWHRFGRFCDQAEQDVETLRPLLPTLRKAVRANEADWQFQERLLNSWLDNWPQVASWPFHELHRAIRWMRTAVAAEDELGLPAELIFAWWVRVWQPLVAQNNGVDEDALRPFVNLSPVQLMELIKFCIVQEPEQVELSLIERCWQILLRHQMVPEAHSAGLYLTYFGQQLLRRKLREATTALRRVFSAGWGSDLWQAWGSFLQKAWEYGGVGHEREERLLFMGESVREATALRPFLQVLSARNEKIRLASFAGIDAPAVGLPQRHWLPLMGLVALAQAEDSRRDARFLRDWLMTHYHFNAAKQMPRWKRPFSTIYATTIQHLLTRPDLLTLRYPLVCGCTPLDCAVLDGQRQEPDFVVKLDAILERVTAVHCYTETSKQKIISWGVSADKIAVVSPGVDTVYFAPADAVPETSTLRLVMIAPFTWSSGYEYALMAAQICVAEGAALQMDIVGAGREYERLLFTRHDLGLADVVHIHKPMEAAKRRTVLQQGHIFIASPVADCWQQEMLEGMACAVPVVGTAVPTLKYLVRDGKEGLLVPPRQPEAMAAAIVKLAADQQLRTNLGQAARQRAQAFAVSRQAAAFQALLEGHREIV